jgi:hypothetical protein
MNLPYRFYVAQDIWEKSYDSKRAEIKGRNRGMTRLTNSGTRPFAAYTTEFPKSVDDLQLR